MDKKSIEKEKQRLTWKDFLPIILALPLAILIKLLIFSSYHVPTASMDHTIQPGDHILVEKWVFGPRIYLNGKNYRIPGWRTIQHGDILVFNVPKEDSSFQQRRDINYYNWKRSKAAVSSPLSIEENFRYIPIPARTPFVKRVIGLPGDHLMHHFTSLLINGKPLSGISKAHQNYEITFKNADDFSEYKDTLYHLGDQIQMNSATFSLTGIFKLNDLDFLKSSTPKITPRLFFPATENIPEEFTWARSLALSNQKMIIPYKGWTAIADSLFVSQYGQVIKRFEPFDGQLINNQLHDAAGKLIREYTFKQNYYWAMGDNRPYSVDSRAWGLIPEDHIIGITRRIFWAKEPDKGFTNGFRWNRLFHPLQ